MSENEKPTYFVWCVNYTALIGSNANIWGLSQVLDQLVQKPEMELRALGWFPEIEDRPTAPADESQLDVIRLVFQPERLSVEWTLPGFVGITGRLVFGEGEEDLAQVLTSEEFTFQVNEFGQIQVPVKKGDHRFKRGIPEGLILDEARMAEVLLHRFAP